ncbi:MAG: LLM class flavin-dependent oxidoreductase [Gammaproteobacteria bacterium]|nr:MAG: LLM class flavin-dependent oxidoreductase [Gammaproteobacteria bacterium]
MRFGVLDQSPLRSGATPEQALAESIELARHAEVLGYHRYWVAEHHNSSGLMGAAPEILITRIAAATDHIRVGSGGVMLMHYSPYKVAETFRVLEALFPGRIDLGLGRAPGSDGLTAAALAYGNQIGMEYFGVKVADLVNWVRGEAPRTEALARVKVSPAGDHHPEVWLLGSTDQSAQLAAHLGLSFSFAHFIAPEEAVAVTRLYRQRFEPTEAQPAPKVSLGVFVLCAETEAEARDLGLCRDLWRRRMMSQQEPGPWPSVAEARAELGADFVSDDPRSRHQILGTPEQVHERLSRLIAETGADELSVVTITPEFEQRLRSYALLAEAFELRPETVVSR